MKITRADLEELLEWHVKCRGRRPLLHIREDDSITRKWLAEETNRWNNRDTTAEVQPAAIEGFLIQLMDCLKNIKDSDRVAVMKRIQTLGGYGYSSGGVTGRNDYSKDKSRVDGRLIQRKRR
jgi:hypothetical protein